MAWSANIESYNPLQFILLNWLICIPPLLFTLLRLFVRWHHMHTFFSDDIFCMLALVCLFIMAILNQVERDALYWIVDIFYGLRRLLAGAARAMVPRQSPPDPAMLKKIGELISTVNTQQFVFMIFFWTCLWCVKGSLLMFYRRLFVNVDGYMKWWWIVVVVNILAYLVFVLTNFLACLPFSRRFSSSSLAQCSTDIAATVIEVATVVDLFTDLTIMLLPVRLLYGLHITLKQKLAIGTIFCLGAIVMIFSIIRLVSVFPLIKASEPTASISVALWSILVASVAVVIASLPPLKSLLAQRGDRTCSGEKTGTSSARKNAGTGHTSQNEQEREGHIRLQDMSARGCYDSEEALTGTGITRTHEVVIESTSVRKMGSVESFQGFSRV